MLQKDLKRSPKNKKKRLRAKADKLFQRSYLELRCENCRRPATVVHHFIPKARCNTLRYCKDNAISLCQGCHFKIHNYSPEIVDKIIKKRGQKWFTDLKAKSKKRVQTSISFYEEAIQKIQKEICN